MFKNIITLFTNKIKNLVGIKKLGFSSNKNDFCETFIPYIFIHFQYIYNNKFIEDSVKENIKQMYNYINE